MAVSFDFRQRLGSGYFGEVWRAVETGLGHEVALKCIPPDKIVNQGNFFQEAQTLKASEHANIVRVHDTGTLADGRIYVSMEFLRRGSVEDEARGAPLPLSRAKRLMVDVLRALTHAHDQQIVHRDIKPANILIGDAGEGKLSDFGLALPDVTGLNMAQVKQYQYVLHLAPEVRRIQDYTPLSDIYACGVTLFRLVNGDNAVPAIPPAQAHQLARRGEFPPRDGYRDFVPQALKRMINMAMSVDPASRHQSAEAMRHALEQQSLCVDWVETQTAGRCTWTGHGQDGLHYEVTKRQQPDRRWTVLTRKGPTLNALRRMGALCSTNMRKPDADKRARRILQDFTKGRA
ncbi:MAG: serine/threonine protein kinase [Lentisphaerae bacterium]|nr:serine/threonine protein kinase [Lentisphaerota bacterium]